MRVLLTVASMASPASLANLRLAVALLAIGGAGNMVVLVSGVTLAQERTPVAFLGRIFSLRGTLISPALVTSNAVVGPAAEYLGVRPMWGLTGGLIALVGLPSFLLPSVRDVGRAGAQEPKSGFIQNMGHLTDARGGGDALHSLLGVDRRFTDAGRHFGRKGRVLPTSQAGRFL